MASLRNVLLLAVASSASSFSPPQPLFHTTSTSTVALHAVSYDDIADIGYEVQVAKPLGVIFGENPDPYFGLVVDDVEPGLNGGTAGLRVGDQLVSINGEPVIGLEFDDIMGALQAAAADLELQLYRGNVRMLYTIVENRSGGSPLDNDAADEVVVMDENYESPVVVNVDDYNTEPLGVGDVFNALKNLAAKATEKDENAAPPPKKEGGGLFGMFGESVQLDGDEASGMKGQERR